jgi:hypothetical protein
MGMSGKRITKKFPSNLKNHFKIHHAGIFKLVEAEERKIFQIFRQAFAAERS